MDETARQQVAQQESVHRQALAAENDAEAIEMLEKQEQFNRWVIRVDDHGRRTSPGGMGGIQRAEIHFRAGLEFNEAMYWEHLFSHLLQLSEIPRIMAIKAQQKLQWEGGGVQQHREVRSMVLQQEKAWCTVKVVFRKERGEGAGAFLGCCTLRTCTTQVMCTFNGWSTKVDLIGL